MLAKIGSYVFTEKKLDKYYKITNLAFFAGILLVLGFPFISERTYIEEKQMKNTPFYGKSIKQDYFIEKYIHYLSYNSKDYYNDKILEFVNKIFDDSYRRPYNFIYRKELISEKGEKYKIFELNLIYDKSMKTKGIMKKINGIFYVLLTYFSNHRNMNWNSNDIQINYISRDLFYDHPKECYELLTNGKYNKKISYGRRISAILNIDLSEFDVINFNKFLFKIQGMDTEQVDMDYYKMIKDNFQTFSFAKNDDNFVTFNKILSPNIKKNVKKFTGLYSGLMSSKVSQREYYSYTIFLINNILNNFLMINHQINANNYLVTYGLNSMLMKIIPKKSKNPLTNTLYFDTNNTVHKKVLENYYELMSGFELIIRSMSVVEIDIFRGQYFYLLISPSMFIGFNYLIIIVLLILRCFYEIITNIYKNEYRYLVYDKSKFDYKNKKINGGNIFGFLTFVSTISLMLILHIEDFIYFFKIRGLLKSYYILFGIIFGLQFLCLLFMNVNHKEELFLNGLLMFVSILNTWNYVFINIGLGLFMTIIVLPLETYFTKSKKSKHLFIKILLISYIIYFIFTSKNLIASMIDNYILHTNNVYVLISCEVFLYTFRIALFIVMIINKKRRGESFDYEEPEEKFEDEEEKKEEKEEEIKDGNKNEEKEKLKQKQD